MRSVITAMAIIVISGIGSALLNAAGLQFAPVFWTIGAVTGLAASYFITRATRWH